ncbi:hypothetical protein DWG18_11980 [Lysobacter sp. TY2-98]|nr:hypothetical protein DWG18_11980 [Lysobacter sp. TY2-98]
MGCVRDSATLPQSPWLVGGALALFWVAGVGLAAYASMQACTRVQLFDDGGLLVRQNFPLRAIEHRFAPRERPHAHLVESVDSDGDAYFRCDLAPRAPFASPVCVVEGPRNRCEAACARLNAARR